VCPALSGRPLVILLGGRGVLGGGFQAVLERTETAVVRLSPDWTQPGAVGELLTRELPRLLEADGHKTIIWAAGAGSVGASAALMHRESQDIQLLCDAVRGSSRNARSDLSVVFASSAGAIFGGHGDSVVVQASLPSPVTPYGDEKLAQEERLRRLSDDVGVRVLLCRYSNIYGLANGGLTQRGFVSTALRASRLRQPMRIFVSPDTRRDLIYSVDAAAQSIALLESRWTGVRSGIVCDGETRTISGILGLIGQLSRRRVPATYAERPETMFQPRVLRFPPPPRGPAAVRRTPMEVALHRMLSAPMA
jgi:UDP-glucose 4-epimerase